MNRGEWCGYDKDGINGGIQVWTNIQPLGGWGIEWRHAASHTLRTMLGIQMTEVMHCIKGLRVNQISGESGELR